MQTGDVTYLIFLLVFCVDGCLTIIHRIMLHENLGEAHPIKDKIVEQSYPSVSGGVGVKQWFFAVGHAEYRRF